MYAWLHLGCVLLSLCLFLQLMRKNQYEEALFRCEDDRYELDIYIETNKSTIRALKPLKDQIERLTVRGCQ